MCQRPERAFFISTDFDAEVAVMLIGVNALNGLSSFLHKTNCLRLNFKNKKGVNALNGLSSFLRNHGEIVGILK